MKNKKVSDIDKQIKYINKLYTEEKKRYPLENKTKIKNESKSLYEFFLKEERNMKDLYQNRILEKEKEKKINEKQEGELFQLFSKEEKTNNTQIGTEKKEKNLNL